MSYEVKLIMQLTDYAGKKESLFKMLTLPFPPYIGLQIVLETGASGNPTDPIIRVVWNQYSEIFLCEVKWRYPADHSTDDHRWNIESHLACALSDGWELE